MGTVTIDKAYFETLMRRAQFHTDGVYHTTPLHLATVTIPKSEHDTLLVTARHFANLRNNLFRGGVLEETLAILIKDDGATNEKGKSVAYATNDEQNEGFTPDPATGHQGCTSSQNAPHNMPNANNLDWSSQNMNDDYSVMPDCPEDKETGNGNQTQNRRPQYEKFAKRTVLLYNLPEGVTHADITNVVRGGMLLDIYLRTHDRAVSISFVEGANAQEFYRYVKRHDLYIRGKRVEIRWNDRQFILPGHVANKIGIGATRNLVIRNRNPKLTEDAIRDDLEHIHNLVVIKVAFEDNNVHISTNSVHNSMFARTCMMSRAAYRASKVDWAEDECTSSLIKPKQTPKVITARSIKDAPLMNRFQLLGMDDSDDTSDSNDDTSGITLQSTFAPSTIVV